MSDIEFKAADIADISARMDELAKELQTRALRAGLRAAGKPMMEAAGRLAPKDKGHLSYSVSMSVLDRKRTQSLALRTGVSGGIPINNPGQLLLIGPNRKATYTRGKKTITRHQGYKGALVEFGTEAGMRKAPWRHRRDSLTGLKIQGRGRQKNGKLSRFYNMRFRGADYYSKGMAAQPYLQPAYEQTSGQFDSLFYAGLESYLNRIDRQKAKGKA